VLALATRVLGADLLTIDALHRQALWMAHVVSISVFAIVRTHLRLRQLTLSSSLARNSTKAACTSSSGGAGRFELADLGLGLGVGRDGVADGGADPGGPGGGPGVGMGGRFKFCSGVCMGVACGLTPLVIMVPFGVGMAVGPVGPGGAAGGPFGVPGYPLVGSPLGV
jgi:hypothetical protein